MICGQRGLNIFKVFIGLDSFIFTRHYRLMFGKVIRATNLSIIHNQHNGIRLTYVCNHGCYIGMHYFWLNKRLTTPRPKHNNIYIILVGSWLINQRIAFLPITKISRNRFFIFKTVWFKTKILLWIYRLDGLQCPFFAHI